MNKSATLGVVVSLGLGCGAPAAQNAEEAAAGAGAELAVNEGSAELPPGSMVLNDVGFETPESVLYDARADRYLVSNIAGAPAAADGNGFISRVTPEGTIETLKWIDGTAEGVELNAPKGMAIANDTLYVADLTVVRKFDAVSGAPTGNIPVEGVSFLNDVTAGNDGFLYVSDTGLKADFSPSGTDAIYRIAADDTVTKLIAGKELGGPNGLLASASGLWVVTFGSGELYRVQDGKRVDVQKLPKGALDGMVALDDGQLLISSWEGSSVLKGKDGDFSSLIEGVDAPADIGIDTKRGRVLIPLFKLNALRIETL